MKKITLVLAASAFMASTAQAAGPTNIFGQETASVAQDGVVQFDLIGSGNTQLRMGAFDGEVNFNISGSTVQYKKVTSKNLAFHGGLGVTSTGAATNTTLILGVAYTMNQDQFIFNANPVLSNSAGTTNINLGLGAFMPFKAESVKGKLMGGLTIGVPVSPSGNSTILLGLRWDVKPNLSMEAGVYNSATGVQLPGLFRVNYTL